MNEIDPSKTRQLELSLAEEQIIASSQGASSLAEALRRSTSWQAGDLERCPSGADRARLDWRQLPWPCQTCLTTVAIESVPVPFKFQAFSVSVNEAKRLMGDEEVGAQSVCGRGICSPLSRPRMNEQRSV